MSGFTDRLLCLPLLAVSSFTVLTHAEPVRVRYPQGSTHGFLALKTLDGKQIATGEVTQTVRGTRVTSRLIFHFRDGSVDDDRTIFTQRGTFHLVSDHHIQKGPSFPKPVDVSIDGMTGQIISRDGDGKVKEEHLELPLDVANGLPPNLLLNIPASAVETKVSYVAPGDKPRLIHLSIKPVGSLAFSVGGLQRSATDFKIHVELGGIAGAIAPIIGKEPEDFHIWIMPGDPPAFIREEGELYLGGPIWRIEQISPTFGY
jgi:hypothetical protein